MFLGIDFGTSGCRAVVIDDRSAVHAESTCPLPPPRRSDGRIEQDPQCWSDALLELLKTLGESCDLAAIDRLALDATSGTVLLTDADNLALTAALMYHDSSSRQALEQLRRHCPAQEHIVLSASSGLAKVLQLQATLVQRTEFRVCTQADYLLRQLGAPTDQSDYHNALKLGFDVERMNWPAWIRDLLPDTALPSIVEPGQPIAPISGELARQLGLNPRLQLCAGSTDANAAFIATGANQPGDAVSSLGSTLVLKLLSQQPVAQLAAGVYSHRLGNHWLAGGASNAGGSVLRKFFSETELARLSEHIDPHIASGLDYYPLPAPGERFPILDPDMPPRLEPRPDSDTDFLHGLLEGLVRIESQGYRLLQGLGAPPLRSLQSLGGGAVNETWRRMRELRIGVPVVRAKHSQAAYGSARLARDGLSAYR